MKIRFDWKWPSGRRFAQIKITHKVATQNLLHALIYVTSLGCEIDELPTLTRPAVDALVRKLYAEQGMRWEECGAYENIDNPDEIDAFDAWAAETVRRCYPELAGDPDFPGLPS